MIFESLEDPFGDCKMEVLQDNIQERIERIGQKFVNNTQMAPLQQPFKGVEA